MFALDEAADDVGLTLAAAQVATYGMDTFGAGARTVPPDVVLDVMIEQLIGIEGATILFPARRRAGSANFCSWFRGLARWTGRRESELARSAGAWQRL